MAFINRAVLQRVHEASKPVLTPKTSTPSAIQHPHRALPPGKQWVAHEKPNGQAAQRRLRQQKRLELKRLKKEFGITCVSGREGDALILDFPEPNRARE